MKHLEDQLGLFREDLLNIKKERAHSSLKVLQNEIKEDKEESIRVIRNLGEEVKETNEKLKAKIVECKGCKNDKIVLETKVNKCLFDIDSIKKDQVLLNNNNPLKIQFPVCEVDFASKATLSEHVRESHQKDQVCQTRISKIEAFTQTKDEDETIDSEHACVYCDVTIKNSEENLFNHLFDCCEFGLIPEDTFNEENNYESMMLPPSFLPPPCFPPQPCFPPPLFPAQFRFPIEVKCYTCDEKFPFKINLRRHYNESHPEIILFWCDVCFTNFGSDRGLQSHMRNEHTDYF